MADTPQAMICEQCGQAHLTVHGHPACPGHITNGERKGQPCTHELGFDTSHKGIGCCKFHGGATPNHEKSAQIELARQACNRLGIPIVVNPVESLLDAIYEAAGNVAWYRALAAQLPPHPADDVLEEGAGGKQHWVRGDPGVYGRTYHASGIPTGEGKKHVLVQMYDEERDRLAKYRHDAISLGLEKRRVDLEEHRAVEVFRAVSQAFAAMGLSERFNEFRDLFAAALANERLVPTGIGASSSTD